MPTVRQHCYNRDFAGFSQICNLTLYAIFRPMFKGKKYMRWKKTAGWVNMLWCPGVQNIGLSNRNFNPR